MKEISHVKRFVLHIIPLELVTKRRFSEGESLLATLRPK